MKLTDLLTKNDIIPHLTSQTKEGVIEEISDLIVRLHPALHKPDIVNALLEREKLGSTGIEDGIAIPHAKIQNLNRIILAMGRSLKGIDFHAHDGKISHLFFVLLAPASFAGAHLKTLARLSRLLKQENVRIKLMEASGREEIYNILKEEDERLAC